MAITIQEVDEIPTGRAPHGPRETLCFELAKRATASTVSVTADEPEELVRVYKSLIQWISRHLDQRVNVRKSAQVLYVWITPPGEPYAHGRKRRASER